MLTSAGAAEVVAPRNNDKRVDEATGQRRRFLSVILPAWCRKSPKIAEVSPLLYLHGLSSQDFGRALESSLAEIWNAEDRDHARRAVAAFKLACGAKLTEAAQARSRAVNASHLVERPALDTAAKAA